FFNQIGSLKRLDLWKDSSLIFDLYPGAKYCLKDLSELHCNSDISSEFFYQLSQICNNILSLNLSVGVISKGLIDLISAQENLKCLSIFLHMHSDGDLNVLISSLANPNKISKLCLYTAMHCSSLSFIIEFTNLRELGLIFPTSEAFTDFEKLQYAFFPKLQILKIQRACPKYELLIKFLENNGRNLRECYISNEYRNSDNSLNLAIAKFCPNLRKLSIGFKNNELETMSIVYNSCQYLEIVEIWCGDEFLSESEALDAVINYSHKNIYKIILYYLYYTKIGIRPKELESFLISWASRVPRHPLSLVINHCLYINDSIDTNDENMNLIKKYIKFGVVKEFKVTNSSDNEFI
ncbi:hypothetical protein C1645_849788, partial [Glomus cerebriforme]